MRGGRIRAGLDDAAFNVANYLFLGLVAVAVAYPLVYVTSSSFSNPVAVASGRVWLLPVSPSLAGYRAVFSSPRVYTCYANSLFYAAAGTALNVTLTIMAAYPLSRRDLYGRNAILFFLALTMFFSGGLIPSYLLVKALGLLDTRMALVLPTAMSVYYVIVARTFFQTTILPELSEAAEMEGCSDVRFIIRIAIPLSGPLIAVLVLFYAVGHWNAFFNALIYLRSQRLYPLQLYLRDVLIRSQADPLMTSNLSIKEMQYRESLAELLKYALIVVANLPVMLVYPIIQRYFVKGVMIGAIKG